MCRSRADLAIVLMGLAWLGLPGVARAQDAQADFISAIAGLRSAMRGAYGDEGRVLTRRIDDVSKALVAWDRSIRATEARLQPRLDAATGGDAADLRVELGLLYLQRKRYADALDAFDAAFRLTPTRAAVPMLRGIALEGLGQREAAGAAYRDASRLDPADPVKAYLAIRHSPAESAPSGAERARLVDTLVAAARDTVRGARRRTGVAFLDVAPRIGVVDGPPAFPLARYADGFALSARGRYEDAIVQWREAARSDPLVADTASSSSQLLAGIAAFRQGTLAMAVPAIEAATTALPPSSEARRILATVLGVAGNTARQLVELERAVRLRPDDERSWIARARAVEAGAPESVPTLEAAVKAVPASSELHWRLAGALVKAERNAEALEHYAHAARLGVISGQGQVQRFQAALSTMHLDPARTAEAFERLVRLDLNEAAAHRELAGVYAIQDRQIDAFAELAIAAWLDPADPLTLVALGHAHLAAARETAAIEAFQEAVRIAPDLREARYAFAQALTRAGRRDEALRQLSEFERLRQAAAARAKRDDALAAIKAEARRRSQAGQHREAARAWLEAATLEPGQAQNHVEVADALIAAGQLEASLPHLVTAAELDGVSDVHRRLADVLGRLGRFRESNLARQSYERLQIQDFLRGLTTP